MGWMINTILGIMIFILASTIVFLLADYKKIKFFIMKEQDRNMAFTQTQYDDYVTNSDDELSTDFVKKALDEKAFENDEDEMDIYDEDEM